MYKALVTANVDPDFQFDVALSFAGEDREYVDNIADRLRTHGVKVFYDRYEQATLWGKDLYEHLACDLTRRGRLPSSACLPMLGSVRLRGHADANLPPGAARPVPGRTARLLHPPRRCAVRAGRRAAVRPGGSVAAPPEPGTSPPARLGQRLCRAGPRAHRHRAAARPARGQPAGRRPAGLRRGRDDLAAL